MPTYRLHIEYEGTRYSGWQAQTNTGKTVQGNLIRAAEQIFNSAVEVGGAGRTDAGVHAAMQVAHLRAAKPIPPDQLQRKLNDLLPHDIHVFDCERASESFHARHDATSRVYLYQISRRRAAFAKEFVWWIKDTLDVEAMKKAAAFAEGRHDFSAFADKRLAEEDSRIVQVERMEVGVDGDLILVRIAASHFLWRMVRKVVAALVEIGRGNLEVEQFAEALAVPTEPIELTAPPSGLFLESIVYEGERFERPLEALVPVRSTRNAGKAIEKKPREPERTTRDAGTRPRRPGTAAPYAPRRDNARGPQDRPPSRGPQSRPPQSRGPQSRGPGSRGSGRGGQGR